VSFHLTMTRPLPIKTLGRETCLPEQSERLAELTLKMETMGRRMTVMVSAELEWTGPWFRTTGNGQWAMGNGKWEIRV
jgi:hypothetical protein